MIGLNKIGLNQVQLNRLHLNAPFPAYGKMAGGGGSGDGFPQLPGDVTRWHFGGLTNEMMAAMDDPRIEDADHKGRFLSFKNFAWGGMSGVGGYEMNFNLWTNNVPSIPDISMSTTTTSVSVSVGNSTYNNNLIYIHMNNWDINKNHWLKVTSTYEDGDLVFKFYNDNNSKNIELPANGYVNIPAYPEFKGNYMYISTTSNKQGSFTIEQLPLYPGALVFDGVDDYGTCDNFPILTKEKGYTVVALRQWISMGEGISGLVSNVKNWFNDGAFVLEYNSNNATNKFVNRPVSFGNVNIEMDLPNNFTYQTSKSYKGVPITTGSFKGTNSLFVGKLNNIIGNCSNVAIWELVFLDHDATEEELTKIKDYFVKTYPWLFPDQAWTVTGKTNEDEDRATIANITGNGNDLVLSNLGFIEGSGYNEEGEYAGYLVTDGVDDEVRSAAFTLNEDWTIVGNWEFITNENKNAGLTKVYSLYLYNRDYGIFVYKYINAGQGFSVEDVKSLKAICSDGRIYLNDWQEIRNNIEQEATISKGVMAIGYFNRDFTKMAFKNLGIYNNQLLSKEDCIKAYNYLQSLKAK